MTVMVGLLSVAGLCLPAAAQSGQPGKSPPQDLLIKSEVEAAAGTSRAATHYPEYVPRLR